MYRLYVGEQELPNHFPSCPLSPHLSSFPYAFPIRRERSNWLLEGPRRSAGSVDLVQERMPRGLVVPAGEDDGRMALGRGNAWMKARTSALFERSSRAIVARAVLTMFPLRERTVVCNTPAPFFPSSPSF